MILLVVEDKAITKHDFTLPKGRPDAMNYYKPHQEKMLLRLVSKGFIDPKPKTAVEVVSSLS